MSLYSFNSACFGVILSLETSLSAKAGMKFKQLLKSNIL